MPCAQNVAFLNLKPDQLQQVSNWKGPSISVCKKNHCEYCYIKIKEVEKCEIEQVNHFSKSSTPITENYGKISCQGKKKRALWINFILAGNFQKNTDICRLKKKKLHFLQLQDSHSSMIPTI